MLDDKYKLQLLKAIAPLYWKWYFKELTRNFADWKDIPFGNTSIGRPRTKEEFIALRREIVFLSLKKWGTSLFDDAIDLTTYEYKPIEDNYDKWSMSESKRKIIKGFKEK